MHRWAVDEGQAAIAWYRRDKVFKRDGSRLLRALAIIFAAAGSLAPLLGAVLDDRTLSWGYVLLAAAAACVAFDRFFGLSSAWMRDISMINAIQRRTTEFELEWVAPHFQNAGPASDQDIRFAALCRFCAEMSDLLDGEATEWQLEFRNNLDVLSRQRTMTAAEGPTLPPPGQETTRHQDEPPIR
jgi:hypothetical protein